MARNQRDLDFFRPLWRRIAVTAVLAVWCVGEIVLSHDQFWIAITGFGVLYCLYTYFWKWPKDLPEGDTAPAPSQQDSPKQP